MTGQQLKDYLEGLSEEALEGPVYMQMANKIEKADKIGLITKDRGDSWYLVITQEGTYL